MSRRVARCAASAGAAMLLVWASAGTAFAHVDVQPSTAVAGSETTFAFRVPNERDDADTVKVVLALPTRPPMLSVSVEPLAGWRSRQTSRELSRPVQTDGGPVARTVARLSWTAVDAAAGVRPGQFQTFTMSAGPVPDAPRLVFKVLQYYSDGSVVRWIDPPARDGEPPHPAPVVTVVSADPPVAAEPGDPAPSWVAVVAFVAGLLGFAAGSTALVIARRSSGRSRAG